MSFRERILLLLIVVIATFIAHSNGAPRHGIKHNKSSEKKTAAAISRSYIDIDASDPFKVPKSSQYIDQPVPEFVHRGDKGDSANVDVDEEENNDPPPKAFDNIQDDLKHLGLDNAANSGDESRFKSNAETPDDSNHDEPPAAVDQENGANDQAKPDVEDQPQQGKAGESAQSRQYVPHDDTEDDEENREEESN